MTSKRLYYFLLGTLGLLVLGLFGGVFLANNLLQAASAKLVAARLQSQSLDAQQAQLARTKADIAKYQSLADIARGIVPQDKDQARSVREIVRIASANGVKLGSVTFPTSTLGGATSSASSSAGSSSTSATTPAAGATSKIPSQLKPAVGIPGVYNMPITLQSDASAAVPYSRFVAFLAALEKNRRTALVSAVTVTPDSTNAANVNFTLVIDAYIQP